MPPPAEGFASRLILGPALRAQPDRRLVKLVREGYETAFEEIVRRYRRPLGRYAAAIVGGRSEDVTQDAFSKALQSLRRNDAEIELRPWLYRIVRNTALNDLRDRPPAAEALAEAIAGGRNPAEAAEQREELADLMKRLQALPEPQRAAIVMRELEGLSHEEIAAALGLSGGAARQAIYRARQTLRDGLGMLLPLPLLKALLAGAVPGAAETAAGAAGVGGAAGAGVAFKATAATVLVAGAVGASVALDHGPRDDAKARPSPVRASPATGSTAGRAPNATLIDEGATGGGGGFGDDAGGNRAGDDYGGRSPNSDSGNRETGTAGSGGTGRGAGLRPGPSHSEPGRHGGNGPGDDGPQHGPGPGGGDDGTGHDGSGGEEPGPHSGPSPDDGGALSPSGSGDTPSDGPGGGSTGESLSGGHDGTTSGTSGQEPESSHVILSPATG
jgi:RNA polymerase sigma factor (sigma-70 family)